MTDTEIEAFERVAPDNLFPKGYLAANPDLAKAFGDKEKAAAEHFANHGHAEGRFQMTPAYFAWRADAAEQAARYARFRDCLIVPPDGASRFPIQIGTQFESLQDYQCESANATPSEFATVINGNPDGRYIDVGAGLRTRIFRNCLNVEVYPSYTTDVVIEPTCRLPFRDASFDGLGCFAVLEHVREPWTMVEEFARIVRPGGHVFIDWPFLQPVHGFPSHYYNATQEGVRALFERDFEILHLHTGLHQGPDFTVQWILSALLADIGDPAIKARIANMTVGELAALPPQSEFWHQVLAQLKPADIVKLSCGNSLIGVRK
ncbi:MAG TPA: methyltransferase domain-containing protein [Xanthobacteraceae bacterium]|nr:methyltransferase domain-containing protein [Xanthobacteraceae bacterium]